MYGNFSEEIELAYWCRCIEKGLRLQACFYNNFIPWFFFSLFSLTCIYFLLRIKQKLFQDDLYYYMPTKNIYQGSIYLSLRKVRKQRKMSFSLGGHKDLFMKS